MSDNKVQEQLKAIERGVKKATSSKSAAIETLRRAGILNKNGELSKAYRPR